ncbi:MAG: S1C family serine protease [Methyloligellaceae bacterium]
MLRIVLAAIAIIAPRQAWATAPASAEIISQSLSSVVSVLPEWPPDKRRKEEPEGSGVIVGDGLFIATAAHIVSKARSIRIRTFDGNLLNAKLVGLDRATDIALLRIDRVLRPLPIDTRDPAIGERVCAIGNAFGLGLSVTCGVVSAVNKAGVGFNVIEDFVQTDAAVNPGASGGALVSGTGKMVGLLSAIFTKRSDANIGVNFAVSPVLVSRVIAMLRDAGRAKWTSSGLRLVAAPRKGDVGRLGAKVVRVAEESVAARAGFVVNDVILRAGGRRIRKPADFTSVFARYGPRTTIEVMIFRDGGNRNLILKNDERR